LVRRGGCRGLKRFAIGELNGGVESPSSESEEHADDPEWDPDADEMLDTEANRRQVGGRAASCGDVLRGSPLVRRGEAVTGSGIGDPEAGGAGVVDGSSTICTCGNILERASGETIPSRENEIGVVTGLGEY